MPRSVNGISVGDLIRMKKTGRLGIVLKTSDSPMPSVLVRFFSPSYLTSEMRIASDTFYMFERVG